jgi:TPR repeat protein
MTDANKKQSNEQTEPMENVQALLLAAQQGDAKAQFQLGRAYHDGKGVAQDFAQAVAWYEKAAKQEYARMQNSLGYAYYKGKGVAQDFAHAVALWEKAAKQGFAQAQFNLGTAYYKGKGIPQDFAQAVAWYEKAAGQGYARAQFNLGAAYYDGKGVAQDFAQAVAWYEKAAKQEYARAQNNLGYAYYEGKGVTQDFAQAVVWWEKAAEQGRVEAQFNLGVAYHDGKGVAQDFAQAVAWWEKAAKQGFAQAQFNLGAAYHDGKGVAQDSAQAEARSTKADQQEVTEAQLYLSFMYKKGQDIEKDDKESLRWLRLAAANLVAMESQSFLDLEKQELITFLSEEAKKGITPAQTVLAHFYKKGTGVNKDMQKASFWIAKAAQQKDLVAQYSLGVMYMEGENMEKAREQFQQIVDSLDKLFAHFADIKRHSDKPADKNEYPKDIKQWIGLLAQDKLGAIKEIEANKQERKAKQELEDVMAMFAHKFRGPLQSIRYNAEHSNQKQITLQAVETMTGLLKIFSTIATDAQQLRLKLQQDMQGEGTILSVLEKALLPVIQQVLTIDNTKKIRQHYLSYAKKTGQVPATTTRKQWIQDYFQIEKQLQAAWEESFSALLEAPRLDKLVAWIEKRFFPLEVTGFNNDTIHFERYGATESTLIIVMTEMLLNAVKYYSSKTGEPVRLDWQTDTEFATIVCENPSSRDERRIDKGSKKGHKFLNTIARNLQGHFPEPLPKNPYRVEWQIPMDLLVKERNEVSVLPL